MSDINNLNVQNPADARQRAAAQHQRQRHAGVRVRDHAELRVQCAEPMVVRPTRLLVVRLHQLLLGYCVSGVSRPAVLRAIQHPDGVQQAGPGLQEASVGGVRGLALLAGVDVAPVAGVEQLRAGGSGNQLLGDVDRANVSLPLLHRLPVCLLSRSPRLHHGVLLRPPSARRQTGGSAQVGRIRRTRRREFHVLFMIIISMFCYLLCWMPYGIVAMMATFGQPGLISPVASVVPSILAKSSTVFNPVIYILMNKQFHRCFLILLHCRHQLTDNSHSVPSRTTVVHLTRLQLGRGPVTPGNVVKAPAKACDTAETSAALSEKNASV
ncbi:uncharacterized protein LOC133494720 isoform X3 [Syngnathoides biaculeatus]|uniref:uncharacterized protein LOC133494720 isoform X3 n=1 Tax=Syngnathoides biaculeatus TaxID=300417 RepID=UPI002ADE7F12|nr:uncharacterized protein LOC133494720 isoform X3 [Syngnathoides biaculeatus]